MGFPTKNDHFGVFCGYHHLRKHPFISDFQPWMAIWLGAHPPRGNSPLVTCHLRTLRVFFCRPYEAMWFSQALNKTCWCKFQLAMRRATKNFPQVLPEVCGIGRDIGEVGQAGPGLGRPDEGTVSLLWDKQIKHPGSQEAGSTRTYLEAVGGVQYRVWGMLVATGSFGCQSVVLKCWQFKT